MRGRIPVNIGTIGRRDDSPRLVADAVRFVETLKTKPGLYNGQKENWVTLRTQGHGRNRKRQRPRNDNR